MSHTLQDLDSRFQPIAEELIAQCHKAGIPVTVITTGRTLEEQKLAVDHGVSWTMHSKHLPQPPEGKSWAIDLCPTDLLREKGWAPMSPLWGRMGLIGEGLGLKWGGRWQKTPDRPHFEWAPPQ